MYGSGSSFTTTGPANTQLPDLEIPDPVITPPVPPVIEEEYAGEGFDDSTTTTGPPPGFNPLYGSGSSFTTTGPANTQLPDLEIPDPVITPPVPPVIEEDYAGAGYDDGTTAVTPPVDPVLGPGGVPDPVITPTVPPVEEYAGEGFDDSTTAVTPPLDPVLGPGGVPDPVITPPVPPVIEEDYAGAGFDDSTTTTGPPPGFNPLYGSGSSFTNTGPASTQLPDGDEWVPEAETVVEWSPADGTTIETPPVEEYAGEGYDDGTVIAPPLDPVLGPGGIPDPVITPTVPPVEEYAGEGYEDAPVPEIPVEEYAGEGYDDAPVPEIPVEEYAGEGYDDGTVIAPPLDPVLGPGGIPDPVITPTVPPVEEYAGEGYEDAPVPEIPVEEYAGEGYDDGTESEGDETEVIDSNVYDADGNLISGSDVIGNTAATGDEAPESEGDVFEYAPPEDRLTPQLESIYQNMIDMQQGNAEIPYLKDLAAQQQQQQAIDRDNAAMRRNMRGIGNSTIGDREMADIGVRQRAGAANLAMDTMAKAIQPQLQIAKQIYGQGADARARSLDEFMSFYDRQFRSDRAMTNDEYRALEMMRQMAMGNQAPAYQPDFGTQTGQPGAAESFGAFATDFFPYWMASQGGGGVEETVKVGT